MNLKREHLKDISDLIFTGYISTDVFVLDTYFTLRSLQQVEKEELFDRYRYLSKTYNFHLILELLAKSVKSIGGIKVKDKDTLDKFLRINSNFLLFLYNHYNKLDERIDEASNFLDFYIESQESRYNWNLYNKVKHEIDLEKIKKTNQFQYYWIVVNSNKDGIEHEKREWTKIEYMTNSICAFLNPKEYRRLKSQMSITEKLYIDSESEGKRFAVERLENEVFDYIEIDRSKEAQTEKNLVNASHEAFDSLTRKQDESEDEHSKRVSETLVKHLKGQELDEHEKVVRDFETNILKDLLLEKRIKVEVARNVRKRRRESEELDLNKLALEQENVVDKDEEIPLTELELKQGFYHDGVSYVEIIANKWFMSMSVEAKQKIFDEMMAVKFDIDKLTDDYLTKYRRDSQKEKEHIYPNQTGSDDSKTVLDGHEDVKNEQDKIKNMAEKAAKMNISLESKDLIKEKQNKVGKYQDLMDKRKQILENTNLDQKEADSDQMFFKPTN